MVIYNVANILLSESTVATGCNTLTPERIAEEGLNARPGAYLSDITNYVNSQVSDYFSYAVARPSEYSLLTVCEDLYSCIVDYGYPAILGIDVIAEDYPYPNEQANYGTTGHFVVVFGAIRNSEFNYSFYIADPWAGYEGQTEYRTYILTYSQLDNAYAGNLGYMF